MILGNFFEYLRVSFFKKKRYLSYFPNGVNYDITTPELEFLKEDIVDIRNGLRLDYIRIHFTWDELINPTKDSSIDFTKFDEIIKEISKTNLKILIVLNGAPSWLIYHHEPTKYFLKYIKEISTRYTSCENILGFQIGKELNVSHRDNVLYEFNTSPGKYIILLSQAYLAIKKINSKFLVTNGSTASICENFPHNFNYNKLMLKMGAIAYIDVYSINYYGDSYFNLLRPSGIFNYLKKIKKPMFITEIGHHNPNKHKKYASDKIPYLCLKFPQIVGVFWFKYRDRNAWLYGMKHDHSTSDLYKILKLD